MLNYPVVSYKCEYEMNVMNVMNVNISRNAQQKDIYRKTMEILQSSRILKLIGV